MKDQKITIRINKPTEQVFSFITNPVETPRWIRGVVKEEVENNRIEIGSILRNWDTSGKMNEYKVTAYNPSTLFQLESTLQDYKLRYTCNAISRSETEFEYYEWSESGELHSSSMQEILDKLKAVMEGK